ncbi:MAG: hypothetical protein RLZZ618_1466, partial [Pseudomonadota bacterium]
MPATSYDVAAQVAAIRAHSGYGPQFVAGTNVEAPGGLTLPTAPTSNCLNNTVTVTSVAQFNTEAATSCKRIVLAPSATPYSGAIRITGQDIEAVLTGTTITPSDDSFGLSIVLDARRVRTIGGTFNNAYTVGGYRRNETTGMSQQNYAQDVHIYGASFTGKYTQGTSTTYYSDGVTISGHRVLIERVSVRSANGGFFVETASSNLILANSNIVVPKLAARHENPVRINGSDLIAILDTRLRTELGAGQTGPIKHTWRMHAGYDGTGTPGGRMIVRNVQSEGGGSTGQYPGVEGPNRQSDFLAVQGWRYYRAPEVEGNNIASFPHLNNYAGSAFLNTVMNAGVWMDDNVVYY